MSDLAKVLSLWEAATAAGEDYVLASIVRVEGSSYRKPGARMIITQSGKRAGTISGGCLEAEVSKQAWWLTQNGPVVKPYSTSFEMDDDEEDDAETVRPYGLGCGGVVHLLLERRATADVFLHQAQQAFERRRALGCAVYLEGKQIGTRAFAGAHQSGTAAASRKLQKLASHALDEQESTTESLLTDEGASTVWAEFLPPRCGLFIFGAGDDAQPLVVQARTLGWHITVADGRSHLATPLRFPEADKVIVLKDGDLSILDLQTSDAAVVMTHSFLQDTNVLAQLLPRRLVYLGVLGPRYRTADLVEQVVSSIGGTPAEWMQKLHAPVGFDLGADSPATIALSILAEVQATLREPRAEFASSLSIKPAGNLKAMVS